MQRATPALGLLQQAACAARESRMAGRLDQGPEICSAG
jgi:hypothetical protein